MEYTPAEPDHAPAPDQASDQLGRLVATMDRLRSPGGCPWDAEQTHESLVPYAIEETYELVDAIESGDRSHMREELGDLLLQVVFHTRLAQEHATDPFDIQDVARGITDKLIARHPHVFADLDVSSMAELEDNWERLKQAEKQRKGLLDGVPPGLPALSRVSKVHSRAKKAGLADLLTGLSAHVGEHGPDPTFRDEAELGEALVAVALAGARRGLDPETALRSALRDREMAVELAFRDQRDRD